MSNSSDSQAFGDELLLAANQHLSEDVSKAAVILDRLKDYVDEIPVENIQAVTEALFQVGDHLQLKGDGYTLLGDSGLGVMLTFIFSLLLRLPEDQRVSILCQSIATNKVEWLPLYVMSSVWHQHGRFGYQEVSPKEYQLISRGNLEELQDVILEKVHNLARNEAVFHNRDFKFLIEVWLELNYSEAREWISKAFSNNSQRLINFIAEFPAIHNDPELGFLIDIQDLSRFIDPTEFVETVTQITDSQRETDRNKGIAFAFLKSWKKATEEKRENG